MKISSNTICSKLTSNINGSSNRFWSIPVGVPKSTAGVVCMGVIGNDVGAKSADMEACGVWSLNVDVMEELLLETTIRGCSYKRGASTTEGYRK